MIQAWIAQLVAHQLGTREVGGSNSRKGQFSENKYEKHKVQIFVQNRMQYMKAAHRGLQESVGT